MVILKFRQAISIPFKTFNIHEMNLCETGFNWFDISFYIHQQ
jgi:hypothetical protein